MLGILGTDLRTTCACKGTDMTQLYECLGWQRLLWVNPCVGNTNNIIYNIVKIEKCQLFILIIIVESQKDLHIKKAAERALVTTMVPPIRYTTPIEIKQKHTFHHHITVITATEASLQTRENTIAEFIPPPQPFIPTSTITSTTTSTTTTPTTTTTAIATTTIPPSN